MPITRPIWRRPYSHSWEPPSPYGYPIAKRSQRWCRKPAAGVETRRSRSPSDHRPAVEPLETGGFFLRSVQCHIEEREIVGRDDIDPERGQIDQPLDIVHRPGVDHVAMLLERLNSPSRQCPS